MLTIEGLIAVISLVLTAFGLGYAFWVPFSKSKGEAGVQLRMSRSNLIYNIVSLLNEGAISLEDLEDFGDGLKETVGAFIDR